MSFSKSLVVSLSVALAPSLYGVTWVVPPDRFEIERASAVVIGRVLSSHGEESVYGVETVTEVAIEEVIEGQPASVYRIHEPGGVLGDVTRVVPGAPQFIDGDRLLLLLYRRADGMYTVLDLQLGVFRFARDVAGRELLVRDGEIDGWDGGSKPHVEPHRAAEPFLDYVRGVARGESVAEQYVVANAPLASHRLVANASASQTFTASSYTLMYASGLGTRWNVFPSTVSWNQGSLEPGPRGSGASEINAAFNAWNAGGAHYVLSGSKANASGFLDASDGVNNVVFEKNLTAAGVQPFNCVSGGALGMGGMTKANFGAGAHVFKGESFGTTLEADVSMNQGLGACTLAQVSADTFKTGIVHEIGHTLGIRHSDQDRRLTGPCSGDPTLDCTSSALMNHLLVSGLNGALQTWDLAALSNVYGNAPSCTPPSIVTQPSGSTISGGQPAQLSVAAAGTGPLSYDWFQGATGNTAVAAGSGATIVVSPAATTSYWVRVTGACGPVANSNAATITVNAPPLCAAVIVGAPRADIAADGFTLSVTATGGNSFTYTWYQGTTPGFGAAIGTGNALRVHPAVTASYWCRVVNECGSSADSSVVVATVVPCAPPQIIATSEDRTVSAGATVSLAVEFSGAATVSWFQGPRGDTSSQVGTGSTFATPPLTQTTDYWARVVNSCGFADTRTIRVTVTPLGRRSRVVQH